MRRIITILLFCILIDYVISYFFDIYLFPYADELLVAFYICIALKYYSQFPKWSKKIILILLVLIGIGFVSNLRSGLIDNFMAISVSALWLAKIPIPFIVMYYLAIKWKNENYLKEFQSLSKVVLPLTVIFGILSVFLNTGMSDGERYGIPAFKFIYTNPGHCGILSALFFCLYLYNKKTNISKWMEIAFIISVLLTTKGIPYIVIIIYLFFCIQKKKDEGNVKLSYRSLVILLPVIFIVSAFQINSYFKDVEAPRMVLIDYGIKTANDYFPLGSGFATYGSEMAHQYYSPLYYKYGLENRYGLSEDDGSFLNDTYYASIAAELGWIGFVLFILMLGIIFYKLNSIKCYYKLKATMVGIITSLYIAAIASGMIKTAMGVFVFSILGYMTGFYKSNTERTNKIIRNENIRKNQKEPQSV